MKKKSYTLYLFFLISYSAYSQSVNPKISGKIFYTVSHLWDTTESKWMTEIAVLCFSKDVALYRSYDAMLGRETYKKWRDQGSVGPNPGIGRGSKDLYYINLPANQIQRVRDFINMNSSTYSTTYAMPEPIQKVDWKIVQETKKIGKYMCQKATGTCRGRTYTVWFCNDIPYSFGPWKLNGLPGLIMEAEDSRKQVLFRFDHIEFPLQTNEFIDPIRNPVVTSESGFEKMRQAYYATESTSPGISAVLMDAQGKAVKSKGPPLMNNPMDLVSRYPLMY